MSMPALVFYDTPEAYRRHYLRYYCQCKIVTFDNMRVHFNPTRWGHVFYESSSKDGKKDVFSDMRAQRIDWIKATLENADAELYQGWNKDTKTYHNDRRVSIVYENFVVVISINPVDFGRIPHKAQFITAYAADNSIAKIRRSPKWLRN